MVSCDTVVEKAKGVEVDETLEMSSRRGEDGETLLVCRNFSQARQARGGAWYSSRRK